MMFAMKYMNKVQIIRKHAVENVFREIKILQILEHPFVVNLWFTFQDREDIFMVLDLMLGNRLAYYIDVLTVFHVNMVLFLFTSRMYIRALDWFTSTVHVCIPG